MLTRRGWLVAVGTAALGVGGRLLATELLTLAAGAGVLVAAALVAVRLPRPRLRATRVLHPAKVHAGSESRVELVIVNEGRSRTPVVAVRDPFDRGRRHARFLLAPVDPGQVARAAYRLPTERRGVFDLGPLELGLSDAFGLATTVARIAPATQLTVYPRVDPILPLPQTRGHDPHAGADHPTALGSGEDFYALRAYQVGDDLRRVHWPSTARLDELMIRQQEMPWQGRATVVLDVRRRVHDGDSLELAVSAAASIVSACWGRGSLVRLLATDGLDTGFAAGHGHFEAIMEKLATIGLTDHGKADPILAQLRGAGNAGALAAVVTAAVPAGDLDQLARLRRRFGAVTVVLLETSAYAGASAPARPAPAVASVVRVTDRVPFAVAWNAAMTSPSGAVRA